MYDKIFNPIISDYELSPNSYNENYVLKDVLEMIEHIVSKVICSKLYYTILKTILQFIKIRFPNDSSPEIRDNFIILDILTHIQL